MDRRNKKRRNEEQKKRTVAVWAASLSGMGSDSENIPDTAGPTDPSKGLQLSFSRCSADGVTHRVTWKAYQSEQEDDSLRWEFRWFAKDLGYECKPGRQMWRHIGDNWKRWVEVVESSGLPTEVHMQSSRTALNKCNGKEVEALQADQEHWVSTAGLLALMCDWTHSRRKCDVRSAVSALAEGMLEACLPAATAILLEGQRVPMQNNELACNVKKSAGRCLCLKKFVSENSLQSDAATPQARLLEKLVALSKHRYCKAVQSWLSQELMQIADAIDDNVAEWGNFEWHRGAAAHLMAEGGTKRRRIDFHVKQFGIQTHAGNPTTASSVQCLSHVDASQGQRWVKAELAAQRVSCIMSFQHVQVLSIAIDASRIGKPAKEQLIGFLSSIRAGVHASAAPQVQQ